MAKVNEATSSMYTGKQSDAPIVGKSGLTKEQLLQEIFDDVYKNAPELEKEMPKKNSKILSSLSFKVQKQPQPVQKTIISGNLIFLNSLLSIFNLFVNIYLNV